MVSFSCEECGDVFTKKKLDPHRNRCYGATFTCIDCMTHFPGTQYRSHTSCMTEDQKYQGALYKEKKPKGNNNNTKQAQNAPAKGNNSKMNQQAFVEDGVEDTWADYQGPTDDERSPAEPPPEAPTPPSAVPEEHVNVFDYLVATGQTPNASQLDLPKTNDAVMGDSTSLVRYEYSAETYLDVDADIQYGNGPIPADAFVTPTAKAEKRKTKDSDGKKDKKRKRDLHVEVPNDQTMSDAPPMLHSGLTGGIKEMSTSQSPEYYEPRSPLKKSKHSKRERTSSGGLFGLLGGSKPKSSKKRKTSSSSSSKKSGRSKESKLIEYRPRSKGKDGDENQVVLFKPRADVFLSFVDYGADSRGCSMHKALKRFHRERKHASDERLDKDEEQRELFRNLRLRVNNQGEIVLFSEPTEA